jgi:hypothetical protein
VSDFNDRRPGNDAIASTAKSLREESARSGHAMTQTQAEDRVRKAVIQGDRKRDNGNR